MRNLGTIWQREVGGYFRSPIAYVIIAAFLLLSGYFFSIILFATQAAAIDLLLGNLAVIFLFLAPALTMRTLAEERRLGTDEFLFTAPLTISEIVLGKYLAVLTVYAVMLGITGLYPIILAALGHPDPGPIFTGYLGLLLLGAAYLSVGLFASSLTENQVVAGVIGFALLLFLWLLDWVSDAVGGAWGRVVSAISLLDRFTDFQRGIIDSANLLFYVSLIFLFLFLTIRTVDKRRWS